MNREEAIQFLPLIQAFVEGKQLQLQNRDGKWQDLIVNPAFNTCPALYRIKPVKKTGYVVLDKGGNCLTRHVYTDKHFAYVDHPQAYTIVQISYEEGEGLTSGDTDAA